jgi:hypothetical protein
MPSQLAPACGPSEELKGRPPPNTTFLPLLSPQTTFFTSVLSISEIGNPVGIRDYPISDMDMEREQR